MKILSLCFICFSIWALPSCYYKTKVLKKVRKSNTDLLLVRTGADSTILFTDNDSLIRKYWKDVKGSNYSDDESYCLTISSNNQNDWNNYYMFSNKEYLKFGRLEKHLVPADTFTIRRFEYEQIVELSDSLKSIGVAHYYQKPWDQHLYNDTVCSGMVTLSFELNPPRYVGDEELKMLLNLNAPQLNYIIISSVYLGNGKGSFNIRCEKNFLQNLDQSILDSAFGKNNYSFTPFKRDVYSIIVIKPKT